MKNRFIALGRLRHGQNKTEAAHGLDLEMPSPMLLMADGSIEFHEVKGGFITDDGMVKARVAAQTFPWFRFVMYQYDRRGCKVRELPVL